MVPALPVASGGSTHAVAHHEQRSSDVMLSVATMPARPDTLILDRGEFPGIDACQAAAREAHASGWMVYIGGPSLAFDPWPEQSAVQLIQRGLGVLPVYAPGSVTTDSAASQGTEAASLAVQYGIPAGSLILLDIEAHVFRSAPDETAAYIRDWNRAVRANGYRPSTYSTADGLAAVAALGADTSDAAVVAAYPHPSKFWGPPSTAEAPIGAWPQARGWQFTNEVVLGGVNVDVTSINFPLASSVGAHVSSGHRRARPPS